MYKFEVGDEVEFDYATFNNRTSSYEPRTFVGVITHRETEEYEDDGTSVIKRYIEYRVLMKDLSPADSQYFGASVDFEPYVWVDEFAVRPLDRNSIRFVSRRVYEEAYRV